jgi:hypothetical protein
MEMSLPGRKHVSRWRDNRPAVGNVPVTTIYINPYCLVGARAKADIALTVIPW